MLWRKKDREKRRAQQSAHLTALDIAQAEYDRHADKDVVVTEGDGPGYTFVSAASPKRVAWDTYFYAMQDLGFSAWDTKKRFDKELKTND